jgi:hypothetical protein
VDEENAPDSPPFRDIALHCSEIWDLEAVISNQQRTKNAWLNVFGEKPDTPLAHHNVGSPVMKAEDAEAIRYI